jgi:hypothetical protein
LNWNPSYSYATIPPGMTNIPAHWVALSTPVTPPERGYCDFRNITIEDVEIVNARRIFLATGLPDKPITSVKFANITAQGNLAGSIEYARDWKMQNVKLLTLDGEPLKVTNSERVDAAEVSKAPAR